jgi:hypothetical protein
MAPAADHAVLSVFGKAPLTQPGFEAVEGVTRRDVDDDVDVLGGADGRRARVADPERHRGSTDEDDLVEQRAECFGGKFQ